jgi:hypothetical protein
MMRRVRVLACLAVLTCPSLAHAQALDDAIFMRRNLLCTGFLYSHDRWDQYWEGSLKRENENIGTITTRSVSWMGTYGITDRLNVVAMLPYVWTNASQGVLHGMKGVQDVSVGFKYNVLDTPFTGRGSLRTILVASAGTPATDYTPDFLPMSIGSASRRVSARATSSFQAKRGWFLGGTAAYTWRGNVTLDRGAYFTDGQLHHSDQVAMPDVFEYTVRTGWDKGRLYVPLSFTQQTTLGGGDIRRQDMPFVSNRMNMSRLDAMALYYFREPTGLGVKLGAAYTLAGRNVGQSTTLNAGLMYVFSF